MKKPCRLRRNAAAQSLRHRRQIGRSVTGSAEYQASNIAG